MPRRWDATRVAELTEKEKSICASLSECTDKLQQMYATDGAMPDADLEIYNRENLRHGQLTRDLQTIRAEIADYQDSNPVRVAQTRDAPLNRFVRGGAEELDADERARFLGDAHEASQFAGATGQVFLIDSDFSTTPPGGGTPIVEEQIRPRPVEQLQFYGGAAQMCQQFNTASGNEFRIPQADDASTEGVILGEQGADVNAQDINFDDITFYSKTAHSRTIPITREMMTDGIFDVGAYAQRLATRRMGRAWDKVFTTGGPFTSNGQPPETAIIGVHSVARDGNTTEGSNTVSFADIVKLIYTVPRAYREGGEMGEGGFTPEGGGRIGFLISDAMESHIRQMVDQDGRPLWQPHNSSIAESAMGGMILGYPYMVSGSLAGTLADGETNSMLFGNFSYYACRMIGGMEIFRFQDSRTMQKNQIEILGFSRRFGRAMVKGRNANNAAYQGIDMIRRLVIKA